ncbi:hypothetical protein [Longispora albida]|uniref:hypothetical protein n=1 Tax=Longispora albida TaxID=203523 RepID=UPI0003815BD4|nr:hypothetical protein [Longispora albida]
MADDDGILPGQQGEGASGAGLVRQWKDSGARHGGEHPAGEIDLPRGHGWLRFGYASALLGAGVTAMVLARWSDSAAMSMGGEQGLTQIVFEQITTVTGR